MRYMRIAFFVVAFNYVMFFCYDFIGVNFNYIKYVQAMEYNVNQTKNEYSSVTSNRIQINDPYYNMQWFIPYIEDNDAWQMVQQKRKVRVAVVDTGIDYNHPDLKNRVSKNLGYNFIDKNSDAMDDNGHGTHVAGIIAAEANNNIGITGVVGTLDVKIIPIKVLDKKGEGFSNIIAEGIEYAVKQNADIINLSINFNRKDEYIEKAILYARNKGVFVVVSSGNDNINCDLTSPAGDEGAYTVAAVDSYDNKAYFSNYGDAVQISAPGVGIFSTMPGGKYKSRSGTSMAAPLVTGVAAMMKAQEPSIEPEEIEKILNETASKKKTIYGMGSGRINAKKALTKLINDYKRK